MANNDGDRLHSTPKSFERGKSSAKRERLGPEGSPSLSLEETGDSTRSLLSVLSHSSIRDLGEDILGKDGSPDKSVTSSSSSSRSRTRSSYSSTRSRSRSKSRSKSRSRSTSRSRSRSRSPSSRSQADPSTTSSHSRAASGRASSATSRSSCRKISRSSTSSSSQTTSSIKSPQYTPYEKWLIEKTKQERQKARMKMKQEREKQMKEEEEKKIKAVHKEVIGAKVEIWITEKTEKMTEQRKASARLERTKKEKEEEEKRKVATMAKENRKNWTKDKRAKEEERLKKLQEEEQAKEAERRRRKEESEAAYRKWKEEAKKKPLSPGSPFGYQQGEGKGYDRCSYPTPSFYNPVPWMPIPTPQEPANPPVGGGRGKKKKSCKGSRSSTMQIQQPLSPPLLFKERSAREKARMSSRPR